MALCCCCTSVPGRAGRTSSPRASASCSITWRGRATNSSGCTSCCYRSKRLLLNWLPAFQGFDERRDRTIERIRDGTEQLCFAVEDLDVGRDGLGAGEQDI